MKSIKFFVLLSLMTASLVFAAPHAGFAQQTDPNIQASDPKSNSFQLVSCTNEVDKVTGEFVAGTECDYNQLVFTITRIVKFVLYLVTPIVLGMILFMGFKFLTANGNPSKLADAKKMFTPIFIGVIFILGAYLIVYKFILQNLLAPQIGDIQKTDIINTGGTRPGN